MTNHPRSPRQTFTFEMSSKDFNYIVGPLRQQIREREFEIFKMGREYGNIGDLLRYSQKLLRRLEIAHKKAQAKWTTPEQKRMIRKIFRNNRVSDKAVKLKK